MEDSSQTGFLFSLLGSLPRAALPNTQAPAPTVPQWWREDQAVCDKGKVSVARTTASRPPPWRGRVDGRVPACSRPVSPSVLWPDLFSFGLDQQQQQQQQLYLVLRC